MKSYSNSDLADGYRSFGIRYCELAVLNHIQRVAEKIERFYLELAYIYKMAETLSDPAIQLRLHDYDLLMLELSFERGHNETVTDILRLKNTVWKRPQFPTHRFDSDLLTDSLVVVKHKPRVPILQPKLLG